MILAKARHRGSPVGPAHPLGPACRLLTASLILGWTGVAAWAHAPSAEPATAPTTLKQVFEAAWLRQPEARSRQARQDAAGAQREVANSWTSEPVSLELSTKTDHLHKNQGGREDAVGLSFPLWLPGERNRSAAVAQAEERVNASRVLAAQLRTAATVREAYWQWQRAAAEHALALERLASTQQLAADVAKRVKAGDLARADQHQADGAVAAADAALAEALSARSATGQALRALSGEPPVPQGAANFDVVVLGERQVRVTPDAEALASRHPALLDWRARLELARRASELARVQTRANPELTLEAARGRGQADERYQQSFTATLRIPFGSDSRNRVKVTSAQAELIEAESQLRLEQDRVQAELDSAHVRLDSAEEQLLAADRRVQLARESRSFFQKSYRLGETDLPTRLRIELEAVEAERQAKRAHIEVGAALSNLRQAQGLLPD